jgi:hypothetical protein
MPYSCRGMVDNRPSSSPYFLLAKSFYSWVFPLHTAHENIWKYSWIWARRISTFIWAFPKMPTLLRKHYPKGLQYPLDSSKRGLNTHPRSRCIFRVCHHVNGHFSFNFPQSTNFPSIFLKNHRLT